MLENSEGPVPVKNYPPIIKKIMNIMVIMLAAVIAITGIFLLVSGIWLLVDDISIRYFGFDTVFWFLAFMGTGVLVYTHGVRHEKQRKGSSAYKGLSVFL